MKRTTNKPHGLEEIKTEMNELHKCMLGRAKLDIKDACVIGRLFGQADREIGQLNKGKQRGKDGWIRFKEDWVKENCRFSYMQGHRYRHLAEAVENGLKVEDGWTLTDAYVAAGIIRDPKDTQQIENDPVKKDAGNRANKSRSIGNVEMDLSAPKIIHRKGDGAFQLIIPKDKKDLNDIRPYIGAAMENEQFLNAIKGGLIVKMEGK